MQVVIDPGVFVSGLITPHGLPARLVRMWGDAAFDVVVSPMLLEELEDVLARPHISKRVGRADAATFLLRLENAATLVDDPPAATGATADPDDDYLVALARAAGAHALVSGDRHFLDLADTSPPVLTPRALVELLERA